jgi:molecular chaperone Hsp33
MGSVKDAELLDLTIAPERLLTRLFITVGVVPMPRRPIRFKCRCSQERSERILASFPVEEVRSYAEDGKVHMTCEFCRMEYVFTVEHLESIARRHNPETARGSSS